MELRKSDGDSRQAILMLGASMLQAPAFLTAKRLGLRIIAIDRDPSAPAARLADSFFPIDIVDFEGALTLARKERVSGVFTMQSDVGIPTMGFINESLGLAGVSTSSAKLVTDKVSMRMALQRAGVRQPQFGVAHSADEALEVSQRIGFPCMIKAPDSSGSRGIIKVVGKDETGSAFRRALEYTRSGRVVVEEFVDGIEFGSQLLRIPKAADMVFVHNDTVASGPFPVPVGHSFPSMLPSRVIREAEYQSSLAADALGLDSGSGNVDLMYSQDGGVSVIEFGARIGATCLPELVEYHTGVDLISASIEVAMGWVPQLQINQLRVVAARILESPQDGLFSRARVPSDMANANGIIEWEIEARVGDKVSKLRKGPDRIGKVLTTADSPQVAEMLAEAFSRSLVVEVRAEGS